MIPCRKTPFGMRLSHTQRNSCYGEDRGRVHDTFKGTAMKFRPAALRHLEAAEQLDQVVRLASAPAWLMTGVLAAIVGVAVTWATIGTVNTTVTAPGVLTYASGVSTLDATTSGQVARLWVPPGQLVT